ncbi:hypothetical protein LOAG_01818 [Loa loa]|uniref:Uncharacterized protein n=1 Tax=Loa loa TaxID=7209 RepID=A0A1S0U8B5_LOALO|nr:hypothetical protein LOAG_01818 [Loa loa]EFO26667.1 hypothetical protein LOAG_01818 [Loa loa]
MGERFPRGTLLRTHMNFEELTNDVCQNKRQSKQAPIRPDHLYPQNAAGSKKRVIVNLSAPPDLNMRVVKDKGYADLKRKRLKFRMSEQVKCFITHTTVAPGNIRTIDKLVPNTAFRRHFYAYDEQDIYANEPELSCAVCRAKVLKKFLELHAWMHLSWVVQVGDRHPFQCTRCEFAAFRIPDVLCHTKEIHGNVDANLFIPTVPHEILQFFLKKVLECFPPMNYSNV